MLQDIIKEIRQIQSALERLQTREMPRVIGLTDRVRVIDDTTARAAGYSTTVQVTGVGGLPSKIKGIWYTANIFPTNLNTATSIAAAHPSSAFAANSVAGSIGAAGINLAGGGFSLLDNNGQCKVTIGGGTNRWILDVFAYLI